MLFFLALTRFCIRNPLHLTEEVEKRSEEKIDSDGDLVLPRKQTTVELSDVITIGICLDTGINGYWFFESSIATVHLP